MMYKSWQRIVLVSGFAAIASVFLQACGQTADTAAKTQSSESIERSRVSGPVGLQVFVEENGRITSIGLASGWGRFVHNDLGNLETVVYDNGYIDAYTYNDKARVIEVTRSSDQALVENVFTFDFTQGYVTSWDAASEQYTEHELTWGASFYDRLVTTVFDHLDKSTVAAGLNSDHISFVKGNCVCQYGNASSCEGGNGTTTNCQQQGGCGNNNPCVWRGALAQ